MVGKGGGVGDGGRGGGVIPSQNSKACPEW